MTLITDTTMKIDTFSVNLENWSADNPLYIAGTEGCGKSTLANLLSIKTGAHVIDCDILAKRMVYTEEQFNEIMDSIEADELLNNWLEEHQHVPYDIEDHSTVRRHMEGFYQHVDCITSVGNDLYILEGSILLYRSPYLMSSKPLIVPVASRVTNLWRRAKHRHQSKGSSFFSELWDQVKDYQEANKEVDDQHNQFLREVMDIIWPPALPEGTLEMA